MQASFHTLTVSGVSTQNGAHGKVYMCALFNKLTIRNNYNFRKDES